MVFCTAIGKYFYNSVREDGLVNIGRGGLVFEPGSGGTIQEVFQDGCVNYYAPAGGATPMVFVGKSIWDPGTFPPRPTDMARHPRPVYPFVRALAGKVANGSKTSVLLSDDTTEIVNILLAHDAAAPPVAPNAAEYRLSTIKKARSDHAL